PNGEVTCTAAINLAALLSTRAYGRHRVAWVLREGNNTRAILESDTPGHLGRALRWRATELVYRAPDRVVTISNGVADGLVRDFGVGRGRGGGVHNPAGVARVSPHPQAPRGTRAPSPVLIRCRRLQPAKGVG